MGESASTDHVKRVESELAKEDSLLANMIQQAPGMLGMAFMFIITILLGIWLQPWFDAAGLQAFGESGSTEVRWIALRINRNFCIYIHDSLVSKKPLAACDKVWNFIRFIPRIMLHNSSWSTHFTGAGCRNRGFCIFNFRKYRGRIVFCK